jgi:hypothetical protein
MLNIIKKLLGFQVKSETVNEQTVSGETVNEQTVSVLPPLNYSLHEKPEIVKTSQQTIENSLSWSFHERPSYIFMDAERDFDQLNGDCVLFLNIVHDQKEYIFSKEFHWTTFSSGSRQSISMIFTEKNDDCWNEHLFLSQEELDFFNNFKKQFPQKLMPYFHLFDKYTQEDVKKQHFRLMDDDNV